MGNNWIAGTHWGEKIVDDIECVLGKEIKPGDSLTFYFKAAVYENYTVTSEGVTGNEVTRGQSSVSPMYGYKFNNSSPYVYNFPAAFSFSDPDVRAYRIAAYVSSAWSPPYDKPYLSIIAQNADDETAGFTTVVYVDIDGVGTYYDYFGYEMPSALITQDDLYNSSAPPSTYFATPGDVISSIPGNDTTYLVNADYYQYVERGFDFPVFDSLEHAQAYLQDHTNETIEGLISKTSSPDPQEEYLLDQKYYFLHNIFTHQQGGNKTEYWRNYRWKPGYNSKIRMYRVKPTSSRYYTLVLTVPGGLSRLKGPKGVYTDEDAFVEDTDTLQTHYCEYSFTISRVAPKDVMTVTDFDTNIPIFGSAEDATKYANDEIGIEDAVNYSDILAFDNEYPEPDFGDADVETETGVNGQTYMAGSAVYVLTKTEMLQFFTEIFKIQDPSFINAFKDGNLLFGDNQANAIIGCQYFPFDASEVCSLESVSGSIWVGGWESQTATGKKVNMNDKVLTVGEFFFNDMYQDFRDYEPYTNLYVQLPYCGTYQLSIQKYLNKTVKIEYAVDIFTGACTAMIYANNILLDSMDGMIGSQRPVTGRTAANMLQAITRGSASVAAGVAGGMKAAGVAGELAGTAGAIGGALPAFGANIGGGAMIGGAHLAAGGAALGAAGAGAIGLAGAGVAAVAGVDMMYKAKNAYADPPMASRGQYSGNLGMFANQKVHFIVAIRHNYRPENEIDMIGYPSGRSGVIGSFSGFLKSSCVYLADGFIGSVQERNEILEMIAKGIYI